MATLGIVGGIGPESTIEYYRRIIAIYQERHGANTQPSIVIDSVDAYEMLGLFAAGRIPDAIAFVSCSVRRLADAGASLALIAANTPHAVFDDVQARSPIPLLSIVDAACDAVRTAGWSRAALLGTRYTMAGRFYEPVFARAGIEVVLPSEADQAVVHDVYMTELVRSRFLDATRDRLVEIVARLHAQRGVDAVILGGTELPLLLRGTHAAGVPLVDTTAVHAQAAVDRLWPGAAAVS
jgi:aspartate racemase